MGHYERRLGAVQRQRELPGPGKEGRRRRREEEEEEEGEEEGRRGRGRGGRGGRRGGEEGREEEARNLEAAIRVAYGRRLFGRASPRAMDQFGHASLLLCAPAGRS